MNKPRTSQEEIENIKHNPNDRHSIKLISILYGRAKKGSEDEAYLYMVLLRRCIEETRGS